MSTSVDDLIDNSFLSLAGAVKRAGGYAKDRSPFSEFAGPTFCVAELPAIDRARFRACSGASDEFGAEHRSGSVAGLARHPEQ